MKYFILLFVAILFAFSSCTTRVVTTAPSNKVVVVKAPRHHKVVVVNGKRYYRWNGNYYRKTNRGYVVVKI